MSILTKETPSILSVGSMFGLYTKPTLIGLAVTGAVAIGKAALKDPKVRNLIASQTKNLIGNIYAPNEDSDYEEYNEEEECDEVF